MQARHGQTCCAISGEPLTRPRCSRTVRTTSRCRRFRSAPHRHGPEELRTKRRCSKTWTRSRTFPPLVSSIRRRRPRPNQRRTGSSSDTRWRDRIRHRPIRTAAGTFHRRHRRSAAQDIPSPCYTRYRSRCTQARRHLRTQRNPQKQRPRIERQTHGTRSFPYSTSAKHP
jgi:hypothetical protein